MPINTDLNIAPYFDDFDVEKQFYKILFKPAYAVQARELTQLQTILQNQVEQFGDNIYQEGTVIKGCSFTNLDGLQYVKVIDKSGFDAETFISGPSTDTISGILTEIDIVYELESATGLKASVITATRGFETRPPDLNTFYINYLNTETAGKAQFDAGETLTINRYKYNGSTLYQTDLAVETIAVTLQSNHVGKSFGIQAAPGVIFQKGHFLFTTAQTLIVSKYTDQPDDLSVGYEVKETLISSLQDNSLYDNANGSVNENAPGSDRLKLVPKLVVKTTSTADADANFFTLIRYQDGNAVTIRDVAQFNSIAEELAKRTYEESGNYIVNNFKVDMDRRSDNLTALVGKGTAYVKGFRVENSGKINFTIDNVANTAVQDNQATTVDYGSYVDIDTLSGTIGNNYEQVNLQNNGGVNIGTAFARNITETKLYLFGVKMQSPNVFESVTRVVGTAGVVIIAAGARVKEFRNSPMIFDTGVSFMRQTTDLIVPERGHGSVTVTNNTVTLTAATDEDFAIDQSDAAFVDASNTKINILTAVTSNNNSTLTINLDPADNSDPAGEIYYNKRLKNAKGNPHSKLSKQVYVKNTYSTSTQRYSLGFPDVYEIVSVKVAGTPGGTEYKDSFKLQTNQNDHFYDISYMEYIGGRPQPPAGQITIILKCFEVNTTSGSYYFNINSYPIDDSASPAANTVRSSELDTYTASNGKVYNLRNCFDFRPHVNKDSSVDYTDTTEPSAGIISTAVGGYTTAFTGTFLIPPLASNITSDIESYLSRIDLITIDSYGETNLVKGEEDENPIAPSVGPDELVVTQITIPGYPALSQKEAQESGKFDCAVQIKAKGTPNYTMRDIEKIEKRIEGLEYYISLNQLEQDSENLLILDENGLSRFKNGYIVDPMNDTNIANTDDPNYKAAIHFDRRIMTPALNTFPLDLKYKSASSASIFPSANQAEVGTIGRNANVELLSQPYATNFRNCVSNFWKYNGQASLSPSHDMAHDTVQNPTPINIDIAGVFQDLQEFLPITGTIPGSVSEELASRVRNGNTLTSTFSRTQQITEQRVAVNDVQQNSVGDFVTNVSFEPFMRSRDVKVYVSGLRPNTRHYFYFDTVAVDSHVTPGTVNANSARDVGRFGSPGDSVSTDANGVLRAIFRIPDGTFYVGDRTLTVVDVNQFSSIDSASTSKAEIAYHAYNITQEKSNLSTRIPEFTIVENSTTRTLANRVVTQRLGDPLAQTFFIKKGMGKGSNSVFISKIDLYFKRKSAINGVTITLREVVNGYPSSAILPFSKTHLQASEVSVSDNASAATSVEFEAPIRMDVEKEYAVVIMPDANDPNYLHFTSKVGGTDLTPGSTQGQPVVMDWGDGVLFTSTNNRAWKSYQDEDIKFALYRHNFNSATGSITLTNNDHEFLTLSAWDGRFTPGEIVYKDVSSGYAVSMIQNTNVITQSGNDFAVDYAAGDYIHVTDSGGTNTEVFKIASVDSSTQMTTEHPISFNGSAATGKPVVAGIVSHYNRYNRAEMHLKESSATLAKRFLAGDTVTGASSGRTGTIGTVDNVSLSYVQPMIQKTNDSVTTTAMSGTFSDPSNVSSNYTIGMKFGANNEFTRKGVIVYSKSNNFLNTKPFDITIDLTNKSNVTSTPFIDIEMSTLLAYQYKATNSSATTSKYISKTVELAEDLDAEDMNLYLTGYRPNGTDIKVYIRPQHAQDSAAFDTINWIELELFEGVNTYSSKNNTSDFREYRYRVADANKNSDVIRYTSTAGTFDGYRKFAIKIELIAPNIYNVPFVKDYRGIALT